MPVTGEAICSTAGAIFPAVNMLDKALINATKSDFRYISSRLTDQRLTELNS